jgi:hypothetical protein
MAGVGRLIKSTPYFKGEFKTLLLSPRRSLLASAGECLRTFSVLDQAAFISRFAVACDARKLRRFVQKNRKGLSS